MAFRLIRPISIHSMPSVTTLAKATDISGGVAAVIEQAAPEPTPANPVVVHPVLVEPVAVRLVTLADGPGHATTEPVYAGAVRIVDHNEGARGGRTGVLALLEPKDSCVHPFQGLRWSRSRAAAQDARGQRLHIVISHPGEQEGDDDVMLYVGEGLLNWWTNDPANGMKVTLRFDAGPEGADWHPLRGLEADRGAARNGDLAYLACWAVADNEVAEDPRQARRASKPFASLTAVQQSQIKCRKDERFQAWCHAEAAVLVPDEVGFLPDFNAGRVAYAEAVVRGFCRVASRSAFSHDTAEGFAARQRWQELMRLYEAGRRMPEMPPGHPAALDIPLQ